MHTDPWKQAEEYECCQKSSPKREVHWKKLGLFALDFIIGKPSLRGKFFKEWLTWQKVKIRLHLGQKQKKKTCWSAIKWCGFLLGACCNHPPLSAIMWPLKSDLNICHGKFSICHFRAHVCWSFAASLKPSATMNCIIILLSGLWRSSSSFVEYATEWKITLRERRKRERQDAIIKVGLKISRWVHKFAEFQQ